MHRHAAAAARAWRAGRQRFAPAGAGGRQLQHFAVARVRGQQGQAIGHRVLAGRHGGLVDQGFGGERRMRVPHRAVPQDRHGHIGGRMQLHLQVGHRVGEVGQALDRDRVDAVAHPVRQRRAQQDRLAGHAHVHRLQRAVGAERQPRAVQVERPVVAGAHVVLAHPHQLDRRVQALGARGARDGDRLQQVVGMRAGAAAEAAAGVQLGQGDALGRHAEILRDGALVGRLELLAVPDLAAFVVQPHQAVQRLHGRMRKIRIRVFGLDDLGRAREGGVDVALVRRHAAGPADGLAVRARMSALPWR